MLKSNFVTTVTRLRLVVQNYTRAQTILSMYTERTVSKKDDNFLIFILSKNCKILVSLPH